MKKLLTNPVAITAAFLFSAFFFLVQRSIERSDSEILTAEETITLPESDTAFNGLFYQPFLNDSLPHNIYIRIADSIKNVKEDKELINRSIPIGFSVGMLGVGYVHDYSIHTTAKNAFNDTVYKIYIDACNEIHELINNKNADSASILKYQKQEQDYLQKANNRFRFVSDSLRNTIERKYYFTLQGYKLDNNSRFFIENGKYYLAFVVWDKILDNDKKYGHYERKEIAIRYSEQENKILIPLTPKQYSLVSILLNTLSWLYIAAYAFFVIGLPLQIILSISNGKAFTRKNIVRLNLITVFLLVMALLLSLLPSIIHIVFSKYIDPNFSTPTIWRKTFQNLSLYIYSAIAFVLNIAFRKGYKLQEEQELTV